MRTSCYLKIIRISLFTYVLLSLNLFSQIKTVFPSLHAQTVPKISIGLVKGRFDQIEQLLDYYKIPYELIPFSDLEKKYALKKFHAVFFPCGTGRSLESNISVSASGYHIQQVQLKDLQKKINMSALSENIREFIENGGSGYFSDFSIDLVQRTYNCFEFYHDFPNLGISGKYSIKLSELLHSAINKKNIDVYMPHEGWVLIKRVNNGNTLAEGIANTPKGELNAIIISLLTRGKGEIIYSSYHSASKGDEIMRALIYRISKKSYLSYHMDEIKKWNQNPTSEIIDAILPGESVRTHRLTLTKGNNTIYFFAESGFFQVDLFTNAKQLVISKDTGKNIFSIDVHAIDPGEYFLSIYGNGNYLYVPYAIVVASGRRIIPYITPGRVLLGILALFIISVIITTYQLSHPKEIAGRIRR
ncbi:MAG: hypothetical protein N2316_07085 [Spirochaetes bacterium]|nr:hypothetical protein [Spirochaetota bacterium]